jgi:hypothetical protein
MAAQPDKLARRKHIANGSACTFECSSQTFIDRRQRRLDDAQLLAASI